MSKILKEGGNIFRGPAGGSETIRIKRDDVDPTLEWLEGILGIDLVDFKLGTTGKKKHPAIQILLLMRTKSQKTTQMQS